MAEDNKQPVQDKNKQPQKNINPNQNQGQQDKSRDQPSFGKQDTNKMNKDQQR